VVQSVVYLVLLKVVDAVLKISAGPLGFNGIADPAVLPWLVLLFGIFSTLAAPLVSSYTRHVERQADGYALTLTEDPRAFINAMTRLTNQNLSVAYPPRWEEILFYDHPGYNKRVEQARNFEKGRKE
jgi:STE24 endopeptidase